MGDGFRFAVVRRNAGNKITGITCDGRKIDGCFVPHHELVKGKELVITME